CRRDRRFSYRFSSLLLLMLGGQPVALEFGEMRQRFQIRHAVEVDTAHQVVELVLDDAGEKIVGHDLDLITIAIESIDTQLSPPRNTTAKIRNAETAFPILDRLFIEYSHFRIHQYGHWDITARTVALDDRNGKRFVNLGSSESHAVILHHGFHHVIN